MSDYLFSSASKANGTLSKHLEDIYFNDPPKCMEFHGAWGSLAVSKSHYHGFLPFENESHICVVIGAPILYFQNNDFVIGPDTNDATKAIYNRWVIQKAMNWVTDISGPFTVLLIDKKQSHVMVVTDLMAFIPVYSCFKKEHSFLGTHVDALAKAAGESRNYDYISLADFILTDIITYPYTAYSKLQQLAPGSVALFKKGQNTGAEVYWEPIETNRYQNIEEAAASLRQGISRYINTITEKMPRVAQFISAGEDSRALSGLLPERIPRDAYIFLDHMNREGRIAQKVAKAYGANFQLGYRAPLHYLNMLPEAATLVGLGHQYSHAHSLGFDKDFELTQYPAVFGGFLSDTLLKGHHVITYRGQGRFPFLPKIMLNKPPTSQKLQKLAPYLKGEVMDAILDRKEKRYADVKKIRPVSASEWFNIYPCSMHNDMPNLYATRRLFRSYEPFMANEVAIVAASTPTKWKLNRRLFQKAMKPYLKKSKWLLHADGRLPYFPYLYNAPLQASIWFSRQISKRLGFQKGNQGPWGDWNYVFDSKDWQKLVLDFKKTECNNYIFKGNSDLIELIKAQHISTGQKINLTQVSHQINTAEERQGL